MSKQISPCNSCPWRITTKTTDIPGGGLDPGKRKAMESNEWKAMGCHLDETDETPCAGFVLRVGFSNLGLRLLALRGLLNVDDYTDGGAELHPTMDAMFRAHPVRKRRGRRTP